MKLLKIEKQNDFIYITYKKTYLFFFKKVFTDRIINIALGFYSTPNGNIIRYRFIFCKNGKKLSENLNYALSALTENLKNGEALNLN